MYEVPTELQYKDELRKEEIRIENELEMLDNKDYAQLEKKLKRDLERIRKRLRDQTQENNSVTQKPRCNVLYYDKTLHLFYNSPHHPPAQIELMICAQLP